jgi:thiosulfate/3-mercaptopyruvate sulfurtransferase
MVICVMCKNAPDAGEGAHSDLMERYRDPSPLVSAKWLADHINDDDLLIVDASAGMSSSVMGGYEAFRDRYRARHLPGAVFADVVDALSEPDSALPLTRPTSSRLAAALGELGVGEDTMVVLYDSSTGPWAARVWWLLRSLGHDRAAVLDGGLQAWTSAGHPVDSGGVSPTSKTFIPHERPGVWVDKQDVLAVVRGEKSGTLLNAISSRAVAADDPVSAFTHQIPGSTARPYPDLISPATGELLTDSELADSLGDLPPGSPVIAYCGSAIGAATAALALVHLGRDDVAIYDGSLAEWLSDPTAPLEIRGT